MSATHDDVLFLPPTIAMSVVLVTLNKHIDLHTLARQTINAHYDKKRFAACIVRTQKGVGPFFASGTIVITFGHLDLRDEMEAVYMQQIQSIDPKVSKVASRIVNTTMACGVKAKVYLNRIIRASKRKRDVSHCFEMFPGCNYW